MPVFGYVSESEAAAGYIYLLAYPPRSEESIPTRVNKDSTKRGGSILPGPYTIPLEV